MFPSLTAALIVSTASAALNAPVDLIHPPPAPESIVVTRLPLPPIAPSNETGSCTLEINPKGTGCIGKESGLHSGHYLPDNLHVLAVANFSGAPAAPDPASIYSGPQLIIVKTDNSTFSNGDSWKCITCGVTEENSRGRGESMEYPQAFADGKRALIGHDVVECAAPLDSDACGSDQVRIIPLRWNTAVNGTGQGGNMRELRLHPDNVHIGFSSLSWTSDGAVQFSFFGRLSFNPSPSIGEPLVPRYEVINVSLLWSDELSSSVIVDPTDGGRLVLRPDALTVGELRGFGGTGKEFTFLGAPVESCNLDVFAADLDTGRTRRLTSHPEYVDPVDLSPDDKWTVALDTRETDRQMFVAALRGIPPLIDLVAVSAVSSMRNNGNRRFFQPWLIDQYGDRGSYYGQKINAEGSGIPGSGAINDPEWNARADPRWSWDGTRIVYTQIITSSPACGGTNPLPCYNSTEEGGRDERIVVAHLTSRTPHVYPSVKPRADAVPWAKPFPPGTPFPKPKRLPAGTYTLWGNVSGWANVTLGQLENESRINFVSVQYDNYSDDGLNVLAGSEQVMIENPSPLEVQLHWFSNLAQTGPNNGTKITSPDGFHPLINIDRNIFVANGTLTTTVNGKEYRQPANFT